MKQFTIDLDNVTITDIRTVLEAAFNQLSTSEVVATMGDAMDPSSMCDGTDAAFASWFQNRCRELSRDAGLIIDGMFGEGSDVL